MEKLARPGTPDISISQPDSKRRRVKEEEDTNESSVSMPSTSVWYDDGNLLIKVETTLFKVHRSILASRSTVFESMLASIQQSGSSRLEQCPIITLHADSSKDMVHALKAIYMEPK
jgi:hypothetical protein